MAQKVLLKRSSVSGRMPNAITGTSVEKGELFMNIATGTNVNNFLTTLKANGNSANTGDYIKWSDDKYNESKYQPKGNYLTSYTETYKGTITGVTAGNGLTGGGTKSTGSTGLTLHVGSGTGITVSADSVSISTEYQNKIASGTSAYTIANTLSGALIDVEYVVANALNKINESAGFDENGNSTLPNGVSLTDAINAKPDTDTLNTVGATNYTSSGRLQFIGVTSGASASKQSYTIPGIWVEGGTLYTGAGRMSIGAGITPYINNTCTIGASGYSFYESYINIMHGKADSATTANSAATATTAKSATTANSATTATSAKSATTATSATTANSATTIKVTNVTSGTRYLVGVSSSATTTGASLNVYGGVYMSGNLLYATSDERLKDFTDNISVDFEALKGIPKKYFYWKDKENRGTAKEIGTSAQKLMEVYPEIVTTDDNGNLGVSYERLSIIALAAIDKLHERIKILEEKLNDK